MVLTESELNSIAAVIEEAAGWDAELRHRCSHLVRIGANTAAVQAAFNFLEDTLRSAVDKNGVSGVALANHAFGPNGPLHQRAAQLGYPEAQRDGLRELFASSFKLFRNPAAHGATEFSGAEAKSIIGLVNLMLRLLHDMGDDKKSTLPANVEHALSELQGTLGLNAAGRLRTFLVTCAATGIVPDPGAKSLLPFKRNVRIVSSGRWPKPEIQPVTMFYLTHKKAQFRFPMNHYKKVRGFGVTRLQKDLAGLGFQVAGKNQDFLVDLKSQNSQHFFDGLIDLVLRTATELDRT